MPIWSLAGFPVQDDFPARGVVEPARLTVSHTGDDRLASTRVRGLTLTNCGGIRQRVADDCFNERHCLTFRLID